MNAFLSVLESSKIPQKENCLKRTKLTTVQINMGNVCNQRCKHCHVDASPEGQKVMSRKVIESILKFIAKHRGLVLDITGGAPELNLHFDYFIVKAHPFVKEIIVRSNLTVLFESGKEYLPQFYKENNIHLICSMPCYTQENVDLQRGRGVFDKSIQALRLLNEMGYARGDGLSIDLVYNPVGAHLPPQQNKLEKDYKHHLKKDYDVDFNRLVTITNVPIKRFRDYLNSTGEYKSYLKLLKDNFNPNAVERIMCREFLSIGYDGKLYDCDFNQSLGWVLKDKVGTILTIDKINARDLEKKEIMVGEHCLSCTAGFGSSCQGALVEDQNSSCCGSVTDALQNAISTKEEVREYYGKILKSTSDLKTSACCSIDSMSDDKKSIITKIHPEITDKFYGCGSPISPLLKGCRVLDLGCGTGRDTYIVAALVGESGSVVGVDMTDEQLDVAKKYLHYQMKQFGFSKPNVEFKKGYIEDLAESGVADNSVDVVISNCVINLSPDKRGVFREIFRVLKPGGELYFSDVFTGCRMPDSLKSDPVLYGECLGGALYIEDFRRILRGVGCLDYRVVSSRRIALQNKEVEAKAGMIDFYSMTIRAFKLDDLEDICEDYGQIATYRGTIPNQAHTFALDDHHLFIAKKPMLVCGNTASMLAHTRYAAHFTIAGDCTTHFGPFDCAPASSKMSSGDANAGGSCC